MIPKKIHYIWFGGNPLPPLAKECIESWEKYCPEYEVKCWNEQNFDLNCCAYVKEAYEAKKWAFVSDVARLYALVTEGGIYMDTDVELVKPLDSLLDYQAVSGFESNSAIPTGLMACEKNQPLFQELLSEYQTRHFLQTDGTYDQTTNVTSITNTCLKYGLKLDGKLQTIKGFTLLPRDYLCPKDYSTGKITMTKNTIAIHHFNSSWHTPREKKWTKFEWGIQKVFGSIVGKKIVRLKLVRFISYVYVEGIKNALLKTGEFLKKSK